MRSKEVTAYFHISTPKLTSWRVKLITDWVSLSWIVGIDVFSCRYVLQPRFINYRVFWRVAQINLLQSYLVFVLLHVFYEQHDI